MLLIATALLDCIAFQQTWKLGASEAQVCNLNFTRDCFSNAIEVEMGFSTQLALKSDVVPNAAPPTWTPLPQRRLDVSDHIITIYG